MIAEVPAWAHVTHSSNSSIYLSTTRGMSYSCPHGVSTGLFKKSRHIPQVYSSAGSIAIAKKSSECTHRTGAETLRVREVTAVEWGQQQDPRGETGDESNRRKSRGSTSRDSKSGLTRIAGVSGLPHTGDLNNKKQQAYVPDTVNFGEAVRTDLRKELKSGVQILMRLAQEF